MFIYYFIYSSYFSVNLNIVKNTNTMKLIDLVRCDEGKCFQLMYMLNEKDDEYDPVPFLLQFDTLASSCPLR